MQNYRQLMELWDICLEENLDTDVKSRIVGCRAQMMSFKFFYGINLSFMIYSITDNLSRVLQAESISAVESQEMAQLSIETLERMRSLEDSDNFFDTVKTKAEKFDFIEEPSLPRKRRAPNYKTLEQYFNVEQSSSRPSSAAFYPSDPREHYRIIYFEVLDSIVSVIKERFDQPSYQLLMKMKSFILKAANGDLTNEEEEFFRENYQDDINLDYLAGEKQIWKTLLNDSKLTCFKDIHKILQKLPSNKKLLIPNRIKVCELILVNPATSCTAERSFSTARRMKTWLRSTMSNKRFNSLSILHSNKKLTDELDLCKIANDFVSKQDGRYNQFGLFTAVDFK